MASPQSNFVPTYMRISVRAADELRQLNEARRLLANYCKAEGARLRAAQRPQQLPSPLADPLEGRHLSPRMHQILDRLLSGDSEKQVARQLQISIHTVHTHVKKIHKVLAVASRGELLAKFVHRPH